MRDGEMMLRLLKEVADEEHGRILVVRTLDGGHKEYTKPSFSSTLG